MIGELQLSKHPLSASCLMCLREPRCRRTYLLRRCSVYWPMHASGFSKHFTGDGCPHSVCRRCWKPFGIRNSGARPSLWFSFAMAVQKGCAVPHRPAPTCSSCVYRTGHIASCAPCGLGSLSSPPEFFTAAKGSALLIASRGSLSKSADDQDYRQAQYQ